MTKGMGIKVRNTRKKTKGMPPISRGAGIKIKRPPCAGQYIAGLFNLMSKDISEAKDLSEDWKDGAFNVMHNTQIIMCQWCSCTQCRANIEQFKKIVSQHKKDKDEPKL